MYIPPAFRVEDTSKLAAFIQRQSFATLITHDGTAPFASHLPMLFRSDVGSHGALVSHMARANPQWQHFASNCEILAVFHGPPAIFLRPGIKPGLPSQPGTTPQFTPTVFRQSSASTSALSRSSARLFQHTKHPSSSLGPEISPTISATSLCKALSPSRFESPVSKASSSSARIGQRQISKVYSTLFPVPPMPTA